MSQTPVRAPTGFPAAVAAVLPGILLSLAVAATALALAPFVARVFPIPAMVLALLIGIALSPLGERPAFRDGVAFCIKKLLRWAVALLGLRVALGEIAALGATTALIVVAGMAITIVSGFLFARAFGQSEGFGALAGAGTAVCGASATLATSTVLPNYPGKAADVAFTVVAVNVLSTVAMVLYPPLCALLALSDQATGAMLGATIHDVAQVVGAGYAVSEPVGNTAVVVKLFRVFLLLPVVVLIGMWFSRRGAEAGAKVPIPVFALVFLALCIVNSVMPSLPGLMPLYVPLRDGLVALSGYGLVIAIAALGLATSLSAIAALGWRHAGTVVGTTLVILVVMTAALALAQ